MPRNKRESFIYSVIMCFTMVLWMSMYNVTLHMGHLSLETIREGWIGFPFAFVYAFLFDWFIVSGPAKGIAFRYFVSPESSTLRKVITISCCMVVPMVFVMSLYGGLEACVKSGAWSQLLIIWLTNIPKNIIMALPFQLIVAGPLVRRVFRTAFPEGTVLQEPVMYGDSRKFILYKKRISGFCIIMGSAIPKHKIRRPAIQTVHRRGTVRRSCGSIRFRCRFQQVWSIPVFHSSR